MKKRKRLTVKKVLLYCFIGIISLIGIMLLNANQLQKVPYSFKNTGFFGSALYYDTLDALGYDVTYEVSPIKRIGSDRLVVINAASNTATISNDDYESIFGYVEKGGKVLILSLNVYDLQMPSSSLFQSEDVVGPFTKWITNTDGVLLYGEVYTFGNFTIATERAVSYETLKELHPYINEHGIVFNEYYLFVHDGKRSLWREIPSGIKFVLYQLLLLLIIYVGYKGKRFGPPLTLYEESEPDEHQYAKAVGELYYQAGHWEILIETYYHQLLNKIYKKHLLYTDISESNWVRIFQEHHKNYKTALKVYEFMEQYKSGALESYRKKIRNRKIKEMLVNIQTLENSLDH